MDIEEQNKSEMDKRNIPRPLAPFLVVLVSQHYGNHTFVFGKPSDWH